MANSRNDDFQSRYPYAGAGSAIGAGIGQLFAPYQDPSRSASGSLDQIPDILKKYYDPYINAGQQSMGILQGQYGDLLNNPGGKLNQIGANYQQSPGFQFALQQALQSTNHGAAAGGMFGSPQHDQQNMQVATGLANQDYYNWLNHATGLYGAGLEGEQGIMGQGFQGSNELAQSLANSMLSRASLQYAGAINNNQHEQGGMGALFGGLGGLVGMNGGGITDVLKNVFGFGG